MAKPVTDLASGKCKPCEGGVAPLKDTEIRNLLKLLDGWATEDHRAQAAVSDRQCVGPLVSWSVVPQQE